LFSGMGQIFLWGFQDGTGVLVRLSGRGIYSCEFPNTGHIFLRDLQDGTYFCEVARTGRIFLRGLQDGTYFGEVSTLG
jgi:hypothetical protein